MILRITGGTSILELYEDQIVLRPTVDSDDRPTKIIPLDQVSMIWVSRSFFRTPYLQVVTPDLVRTKKDAYRGTAANVVQIMPGNMPKVDQLQQYLADYKAAHPSAPADPQPASPLPVKELEELARLRDRGILTQEEFDAKKKQLLGL